MAAEYSKLFWKLYSRQPNTLLRDSPLVGEEELGSEDGVWVDTGRCRTAVEEVWKGYSAAQGSGGTPTASPSGHCPVGGGLCPTLRVGACSCRAPGVGWKQAAPAVCVHLIYQTMAGFTGAGVRSTGHAVFVIIATFVGKAKLSWLSVGNALQASYCTWNPQWKAVQSSVLAYTSVS